MGENNNHKDVIILKGRFKVPGSNLFGLFIVFMNRDVKVIDNALIVASSFSTLFDNDPSSSWKDIEDVIQQAKWHGNIIKNITNDLQATMNRIRDDVTLKDELFGYVLANSEKHIINFLSSLFEKIVGNKNIIMDIALEETSLAEMQKIRKERRKQKEEETKKEEEDEGIPLEEGDIIIPVFHQLNPVSGKPIMNVKPGEYIWVRIDDTSEKGEYFINLLGLRSEDKIKPVPAEVVKIHKKKPAGYVIYVKIAPGVYGKSEEDATMVKLKMAEKPVDEKEEVKGGSKRKKKEEPEEKVDKKLSSVIIVILVLLIALIVGLLLIFI